MTAETTASVLPSIGSVKYTLPAFPRQVRLESAFSCVMACRFCHAWGDFKEPTRKKAFMELDLLERLLQEIASWPQPLSEVCPTNYGEWFVNPRWYEMGKMIERYLPNTPMTLPTTGTLLNDKNLERLASLQTLRWLNFSINAYFAETWEYVHRVPAAKLMPRVLSLPERFREMRKDVTVNISMVFDSSIVTERERELFEQHWRRRGFQVSVSTAQYVNHPTKSPATPSQVSCRSIFDGLVVTPDGEVLTGCCYDSNAELSVGNSNEKRLLDIWRGDQLRRLAELHNSGKRSEINLCKGCTFA